MKEKQIISVMGPPGAGKGTQASLLADKFSYYYFETSKLLEEAFKKNEAESIEIGGEKFSYDEERKKWETGELCSPPFVEQVVKKKIKELYEAGESIVLSGSPRTIYEAENLTPFLDELYGKENIKVVVLNIPAEETIFRNSHRRICELMRHPILYKEETKDLTICPIDGSKLIKREGLDDPESIKVRLKEYKEKTFPILDYLRENNYQVKEVDGVGSVAEVFSKVLKAIGEDDN